MAKAATIRALIENARRDVAAAVRRAEPANVIFTSGATEAANMVLTPDFRMGRTPLKIGRLYYLGDRASGRARRRAFCQERDQRNPGDVRRCRWI